MIYNDKFFMFIICLKDSDNKDLFIIYLFIYLHYICLDVGGPSPVNTTPTGTLTLPQIRLFLSSREKDTFNKW